MPPVGQAIGDLFEGMGEGAKKRMSESGTTLTSGVDPDPLIAAAGDAVKAKFARKPTDKANPKRYCVGTGNGRRLIWARHYRAGWQLI